MDDSRFDSFARALASPSRRSVLSGLGAALLAALTGSGADDEVFAKRNTTRRGRRQSAQLNTSGKGKKGKKKKKKKRPASPPQSPPPPPPPPASPPPTSPPPPPINTGSCAEGPFLACMGPALADLEAAIESCRSQCEPDPEAEVCQTCLQPGIDTAMEAVAVCSEEVCFVQIPETAPERQSADQGVPRARARPDVQAAAAPIGSCNAAALDQCSLRTHRNTAICLSGAAIACIGTVGIACPAAIAACMAQHMVSLIDCIEDFGCPRGGICVEDLCCPNPLSLTRGATACNGTCCAKAFCEHCIDGECVGCEPPQECVIIGGSLEFRCRCPSGFTECGGTPVRPEFCCDDSTEVICCDTNFDPPDNKQCWRTESPCGACEYPCGEGASAVCCTLKQSCCSDPNFHCIDPDETCEGG